MSKVRDFLKDGGGALLAGLLVVALVVCAGVLWNSGSGGGTYSGTLEAFSYTYEISADSERILGTTMMQLDGKRVSVPAIIHPLVLGAGYIVEKQKCWWSVRVRENTEQQQYEGGQACPLE